MKPASKPPADGDCATTAKALGCMMAADLTEIGRTCMPFGKYGPPHYPPNGVPIYDLPVEYLGWFVTKGGFPKGRLGRLLQIVHQMKVDGSDAAFDPLRKQAGGRTPLRESLASKRIVWRDVSGE